MDSCRGSQHRSANPAIAASTVLRVIQLCQKTLRGWCVRILYGDGDFAWGRDVARVAFPFDGAIISRQPERVAAKAVTLQESLALRGAPAAERVAAKAALLQEVPCEPRRYYSLPLL